LNLSLASKLPSPSLEARRPGRRASPSCVLPRGEATARSAVLDASITAAIVGRPSSAGRVTGLPMTREGTAADASRD
jgi:hypothetical protein